MASKAYGFSKERGEGLSRLLDASATLGQSNRGKMFPAARIAIARAPSGGIAARSGTTPGSATCGLYELSSGSLVDSGISETVYNIFSSAVAASAWMVIAQDYIAGDWYVQTPDLSCSYIEDWRLNGADIEVKRCGTWEVVHECNETCP